MTGPRSLVRLLAMTFYMTILLVGTGCTSIPIAGAFANSLPPRDLSPVEKENVAGFHLPAQLCWQYDFEPGFIYAVGHGRVPTDRAGHSDSWARAKRAAIDNALCNLIIEAKRIHGTSTNRLTPSAQAKDRTLTVSNILRRSLEYAEIVSIIRLKAGECQVLMRMPDPSMGN